MGKKYTELELKEMGMDDVQIKAVLATQEANDTDKKELEQKNNDEKVTQVHKHTVELKSVDDLVPTSLEQIATYKNGTVVELPSFADGQPFVARITRPSMLSLVKSNKIPNSLLNQATSLFANGARALNEGGKNSTSISELYDVIDVIAEVALLQPKLEEIRSVGMELTDDQLMAIFSYTQRGVKGLEQFRTKRANT